MKAVILAAGSGSNLNPFNNTRPKSMLNIGGVYVLENTLNLLKRAGINDCVMVVGHKKEKVIDFFKEEEANNEINIHYEYQDSPSGIGDALLLAEKRFFPGEYFLLVYGDVVTSENIYSKTLQSFHAFRLPVASICLPPHSKPFGNVFMNSKMSITKIIEKPHKDDLGNYVLAGVYVLNTHFFDLLKKVDGSMEKALAELVSGGELKASIWEDEWIDVGYPWDILSANKIIMDSWNNSLISKTAKIESNVTINGIVRIADNAVVKAGVILEGPCYIGKNCYIGSNTLIRSYTAMGENTFTGYGVELKNCVIFGKSKVGRLSFIGDSVIGENVDLGTGTVCVNRKLDFSPIKVKIGDQEQDTHLIKLGSFIGDNVIVGADNTIAPGTKIEPGTIIPDCYSYPEK